MTLSASRLQNRTLDQQCTVARPGAKSSPHTIVSTPYIHTSWMHILFISRLSYSSTPTRVGLSPIASALAVELVAALLQHPDGVGSPAPAPAPASDAACRSDSGEAQQHQQQYEGSLGPVPHMIRGSLAGFSQVGTAWQ